MGSDGIARGAVLGVRKGTYIACQLPLVTTPQARNSGPQTWADNLMPLLGDALIDSLKKFTKRYPESLRDRQQSAK